LFVPITEKVKDKDAFLAENPFALHKEGRYNKVPVIVGVNSG